MTPPPATVVRIEIHPDSAAFATVGATRGFTATARDANGGVVSGATIVWSSSDPAVVSIDADGTATARGSGGARIEASSGAARAVARVAVRAGTLAWSQVAAGLIHSCGVTTHGTAYCWGDNAHGQTGTGAPDAFTRTPEPVRAGILFLESVTVGGGHTCALASGGAAYCWGNSAFGEGGFGELTALQAQPAPVSDIAAFSRLSAGGNHTCGVGAGGSAFCWGLNDSGQLGNGGTANASVPVAVAGDHSFTQVDAASQAIGNHTCGVTVDGAIYCWGPNSSGELGDGSTDDRASPVLVDGGSAFSQVSAGGEHTCAVTTEGAAWCWGGNGFGQLGDGSLQASHTPVPVSGGILFSSVSAGEFFTCGVSTAGTAHCWGRNESGQLGDGTTGSRTRPTAVSGGRIWIQLDTGRDHACGVVTDGTGYCWGSGSDLKLGHGAGTDQRVPLALVDPATLPIP